MIVEVFFSWGGPTLDVQVSMTVLPKPITIRPPKTRPKEPVLVPAADMTAPIKMAIEQANDPLLTNCNSQRKPM